MPLTPLHWGPAIIIGLIGLRYLDFPTFIISNVIVDIRTAAALFGLIKGPLHGFATSYTAGTLIGILLTIVIAPFRKNDLVINLMDQIGIEQRTNTYKILAASLLGIYLHVTLDSILYVGATPFYPLQSNPLDGLMEGFWIYSISFMGFLFGLIYYAYLLRENKLLQDQ